MSDLAVTFLRLGYLALIWLFILAALLVLRGDVFGIVVTPRGRGRKAAPAPRPGRKAKDSSPAPARLVVTEGPLTGTAMLLSNSAILVGRSPAATLVLGDRETSGQHARIYPAGGGWAVEDLGSTNGTVVAGQRITGPVRLEIGTPVRIGQNVIELGE